MTQNSQQFGQSDIVRLSDEDAAVALLERSVTQLWEVVNDLTRFRRTTRQNYRVTIFGSARITSGSFAYESVKQLATELTKIINVPTLKDHSASGVTGCLKNVGYGTFNNVARSHKEPFSFTNPLIGVLCSIEPLRSKVVLNIMDGTRMVWHGGPLTQNQDFIYQAGLMLVSTDPVAMDTVELDIIEKKRREERAPSVWEHKPNSLTKNGREFFNDASKNLFYRQPGHIAAAGKLGLGVSDLKAIDWRKVEMKA